MAEFVPGSDVRVVIYGSAITAMSLPGGMIFRWTARRIDEVEQIAQATAPKRTGRMAASITTDKRNIGRPRHVVMTVNADSPAAWVHEGTAGGGAGFIYPTHSRKLHVQPAWGGWPESLQDRVRGQRPQPWLANSLRAVMTRV